ncbi:hypothetical protein EA187_11035 [Lujinxingia sediminis]|uniref:DUF3108 domain-containing protein n=1 Tax=Lujinxingia sediminis TaxID=2480984 RepID=A0ABY0CTD3_9DELT|nr:hypothetical protein [Lujinxingia sediminis]RVU44081.1 hypothetical protein EA187_11035 [Lujinxingia sediminis]
MQNVQTPDGEVIEAPKRYPMVLGAWLVAMLAGIWALESPESTDRVQLASPPAGAFMPAPLAPDWQSTPVAGEPFTLRYSSHPPVHYQLRARWEHAGAGGGVASGLDLVARSRWTNELSAGGEELRQRVDVESAMLEVRGPGGPVLGFRAAQEERALKGAVYQRVYDRMGGGGRSERGRSAQAAGAWGLALVEELHRLLTPRFPLDAQLAGERWRYRLDDAGVLAVTGDSSLTTHLIGRVDVEDRLREYMMYGGRPVFWIERHLTIELREVRDRSSRGALHVKGAGQGTLIWDVQRGQVLDSDLVIKMELPEWGRHRTLRARIAQIDAPGQNALPSLPSAY